MQVLTLILKAIGFLNKILLNFAKIQKSLI